MNFIKLNVAWFLHSRPTVWYTYMRRSVFWYFFVFSLVIGFRSRANVVIHSFARLNFEMDDVLRNWICRSGCYDCFFYFISIAMVI